MQSDRHVDLAGLRVSNWIHQSTPEFETRAKSLQREMIASLYNHPAIITWSCHNEPTMVFTRRENLEQHPDPAPLRRRQAAGSNAARLHLLRADGA
ncbi:MAG: hypothetical protein HND48_01415 [Chloroflexi bacterium]|nr:hypothetical protein [Chloroflexota bacterium]